MLGELLRLPSDDVFEVCLLDSIEEEPFVRPRHRRIMIDVLSAQFSRDEVAARHGVTPVTVTNIMKRPDVRKVLEKLYTDADDDLNILAVRANTVLQTALDLDKTPMQEALRAVDMVHKYSTRKKALSDSAEDVVGDLLKGLNHTVNIQNNITVGDR